MISVGRNQQDGTRFPSKTRKDRATIGVVFAGAGVVTFVLSSFHWAEAAEDADPVRGRAKADFMDFLLAPWIFERRSLQRKETTAKFFRFLKVQAERLSRDFVAHLRTIGQDHPL